MKQSERDTLEINRLEDERDEIRALLIKAEQDLGDYCDTLEKAEQRIAELETDRRRFLMALDEEIVGIQTAFERTPTSWCAAT